MALSAAMTCGFAACVSDAPATDADSGAASDASTGGDTGSSDATTGSDAALDAGPSCDAALPALMTGRVQCVMEAGCSDEQCCYSDTANQSRCYTFGSSCGSDLFRCDKPSDCGGGTSICCLSGTLGARACPFVMPTAVGSACGSTLDGGCGPDQIELCSASETCSGGKKCQALTATVSGVANGPFTRTLGGCF